MMLAGILLGFLAQEPLPLGPYDGLTTTWFRHDADVHVAAIPPGSRVLLALDATGKLTSWDIKSGRRLYSQPVVPAADLPQRVVCSPDGTLIAFSGQGFHPTVVRVVSVATGEEVRRLDRCMNPVFSPDGLVLAGADGRKLRRWSIKSGAELPALQDTGEDLGLVAYAPDGKSIAADLLGVGRLAVWNLETRQAGYQERTGLKEVNATGLAYAPDGSRLLVGTPWGIEGFMAMQEELGPYSGPPFFFTRDGKRLVTGYRKKCLSVLDAALKGRHFETRLPLGTPEQIEVAQDADLLMRIVGQGIRLEPIIDRAKVATPPRVSALALLPGGKVRIGDVLGGVRDWDLEQRKILHRFDIPGASIHSFSADGRRLLTVKEEEWVRVWDAATGDETLKIDSLKAPLAAALSPDGGSLAIGLADGTVSLWDVDKGRERARIPGEFAVSALAWSLDGRSIAWGNLHGGIGIADGRTGGDRVERTSRGSGISSMALSPNGRVLVTADRAGALFLWTDDVGREPEPIGVEGTCLTCSPDGRWVAKLSGSSVRLLSLQDRTRPLDFEAFKEPLTAIVFSPDGTTFLTGGWDGSVLLWRVPSKK